MNANGSGQKQLTHDGSANYYPSVSPDGRYIAFTSTRSGSQNIWMMDIDGGNLKQLTNSADATWPQWSPDNAWIVYKDYGGGKRTLWKISVNGGAPVQVTERYTDWPSVSPDGKLLACMYWDEQLTTQAELAILPFDGGNPIKTFKFSVATQSFTVPNVLHWTPDGRNITYIDDPIGTSNILSQSLDGGAPKALTQFKSDRIFWFDWSRDGKTLACARGSMNSDVVLISNLQE